MIKCNDWPVGVCTWSLGNDFDKIGILREQTGLNEIHLGVSPALGKNGEKYLSRIQEESWNVTATMIDFPQEDYSTLDAIKITGGIVPDDCWEDNKQRVLDAIDITCQLGVRYLTTHVGFLDHTVPKIYWRVRDRVRLLADAAAEKKIILLMETGQETARQLWEFIEELKHPALGVNFDPANMILYDKGQPVEAVHTLARWIKHVHIKDALRARTAGTWGQEVVWGTGQVGPSDFLKALKEIGFAGALAIEREAGDSRLADIKQAAEALKTFAG